MKNRLLDKLVETLNDFSTYSSTLDLGDVFEILIIAVLVYAMMSWLKNTRAWALLKGMIVILLFWLVMWLFDMTTILWIFRTIIMYAVIALIVVLQPELRKALETLGRTKFWKRFVMLPLLGDSAIEQAVTDRTIGEIVKACTEMSKVRTGALIVIEREDSLARIEETGIAIGGVVSNQLLINIFEKNTPLHDGAVVIRGNEVSAATCYLPLSENGTLGKELGTRHRAGIGVSEETDSVTVIVSEETGGISVAVKGELERSLGGDELRNELRQLLKKPEEGKPQKKKGRRRKKNEK